MLRETICKNCEFFETAEEPEGWCKRFPPKERKNNNDWCGEFKKKNEKHTNK